MTAPAGIRLADVHAAPGGTPVLTGIDLDVAHGTCTAVIGPSGAGKTTLLRVVAGLQPASQGSVGVAGRDLTDVPADRRRLAVVFQDARLFPSMDVAANVAFPLRMAGIDRDERNRRAEERLEEVGLAGFGARRPRSLSGGEAQRVALARALVAEPDALLLDEPFAAVDPERRDDLRRLVDRVRRDHGLTTLLVTHDREDAAALGDRLAVLLGGRVAQEGEVRHVLDAPVSVEVATFVGCDVLLRVGEDLLACRPERVELGTGPHRGTVTAVQPGAERDRVVLDVPGDDSGHAGPQQVTARVPVGTAPAVGATIAFDLGGAHRLPSPSNIGAST